MKRRIDGWTSIGGSLCVLSLGTACHVVVEKDDGTGGEREMGVDSSGGTSALTGGRAPVAGASGGAPEGGNVAVAGGGASTGGTKAGTEGGGGAEAGATSSDAPYVEACGAAEPTNNDARESALDLSAGATLCMSDENDDDWFYLDAPDDGKGHVIQLDITQEPAARIGMTLFAKQDGSEMGMAYLEQGVSGSVYASVGPGTRTLIDFAPFWARDALATVKASLLTESDAYEPNNDRDAAATIQPGTEISAQLIVPYASLAQNSAVDWYKVELTAGSHVFHLTAVPEDLNVRASLSDSGRVDLATQHAPNRGAIFDFSFDVKTAGIYFFVVDSFGDLPILVNGTKPRFLGEPYKFQID
jgi:hypothetical protein